MCTVLLPSGDNPTAVKKYIIYKCIYSIWYLSHRYCYLPLSWKSWNSSTIAADSSTGVTNTRCCKYSLCAPDDGWSYHPKHVEQFPDIKNIPVWQIPDAVNTVVCAPDDGWSYHPKHVQQFPDIKKLCKDASCWTYIGIYSRCTDPWTSKLRNQSLNIHVLSPNCSWKDHGIRNQQYLYFTSTGLHKLSKNLAVPSNILGAVMTKWSKFRTQNPKTLGATAKDLVTRDFCTPAVTTGQTADLMFRDPCIKI